MINVRLLNLLSEAKKYIIYQVLSRWIIFLLRIIINYSISNLADLYYQNSLSNKIITGTLLFNIISLFFIYYLEKISIDSTTKASLNAKTILRKEIYSKLLN